MRTFDEGRRCSPLALTVEKKAPVVSSPPPVTAAQALGIILRFLGNRPGYVALSIGLLLVNIAIELSVPQFIGRTITALGQSNPTHPFQLGPTVALFLGLVTVRTLVGLVLGPLRNRTAVETLGDVRCAVYDSLQRRPFAWHDNARVGELISRAGTDVFRLQELVFVCLLFSVDVVAGLVGTLWLIFVLSPVLGGLTLAAMGPTVAAMAFFAARLQPRWRKVHARHSAMSTVLQENIAGVRVVKAFARENAEIARFRDRRDAFLTELHATVSYWAARVPLAQFLFGLGVPLVLWVGGSEVISGRIALGQLATAVLYLLAVGGRIGVIGQITSILQNASSAAQRVAELLPAPIPGNVRRAIPKRAAGLNSPEITGRDQEPPTKTRPSEDWSICFDAVSFSHDRTPSLQIESEPKPDGDSKPTPKLERSATPSRPALTDISFTIEPGKTIALVGPTGAGKSTLLNLLPRFYTPSSGRILLGGRDLQDFDREELYHAIAIVFQETFLFSASIAENIGFGRPDASHEEILRAAQAACADEFIRDLAQGYETIIGERGISLSGGQRQRLALARAFLIQPQILVLDDATSAIDAGTEREIQDATRELRRGRTTLLVAQRVASVRTADLILVLQEGRLVEQGRHDELLARGGLYAELFRSQLDLE